MGEESKEGPVSNIKEYIVNGRKNGFSDDIIVENLKKTNWPDDIIESAVKEADTVIPAVTEEEKPVEEAPKEKQGETKEEQAKEEKKDEETPGKKEEPKDESKEASTETPDKEVPKDEKPSSDLLTKPPEGIFPGKKEAVAEEHVKKKFSFLVFVALLLSPIPFIGLGVAMAAIDNIRKNHKSGTIFAILALIINVIIILGIIYILYQIFMLPPENLAGFSKFSSDKLCDTLNICINS